MRAPRNEEEHQVWMAVQMLTGRWQREVHEDEVDDTSLPPEPNRCGFKKEELEDE